jgi:hypothetical protein
LNTNGAHILRSRVESDRQVCSSGEFRLWEQSVSHFVQDIHQILPQNDHYPEYVTVRTLWHLDVNSEFEFINSSSAAFGCKLHFLEMQVVEQSPAKRPYPAGRRRAGGVVFDTLVTAHAEWFRAAACSKEREAIVLRCVEEFKGYDGGIWTRTKVRTWFKNRKVEGSPRAISPPRTNDPIMPGDVSVEDDSTNLWGSHWGGPVAEAAMGEYSPGVYEASVDFSEPPVIYNPDSNFNFFGDDYDAFADFGYGFF